MRLEEEITRAICRHYLAPVKIPAADWVRQHLTIDHRQSADYGGLPMDIERTPHARIIYDFLADPVAEELNVMKSSAAAMTSTLIAACFHRLATEPCNILYLIGNQAEARKMSERYWRVWLRQIFGDKIADAEDQSALHLKINGVDLISGSPTEKMLRGIQFKIIIEDESDTMENTLGGGGQSLEVAERERVKNTRRSKIIRLCTPLRKWNHRRPQDDQPRTRIHRLYLSGDQREYRCPCPHCHIDQPLNYDDLRTTGGDRDLAGDLDLERILTDTHWQCPTCQGIVHEGSAKADMIRSGRWVPTKPGTGRIWSAWHTDMVNLIGKTTWGRIRYDLESKRGTHEEAGVRRAYLAEPEDTILELGNGRDRETILRHCSTYDRGTCPIVPWRTVLYVDVQKNCARFPYLISALSSDGTIHVIDWGEAAEFADLFLRDRHTGQIHGLLTTPIPLRIPTALARRHFGEKPPPENVYITRALIDSGYRARGAKEDQEDHAEESVYQFCTSTFHPGEMRYLFTPSKGRAGRQITVPTIDSEVQFNGRILPLHLYDDWAFKKDLYNIRLSSDPENPSPLARDRPRIYFPRREDLELDHASSAPGDSLLSQLLSERIVDGEYRTAAGTLKSGPHWATQGRNDLGDCLKGSLILYAIISRRLLANSHTQSELPAA